MAAQLKQFFRVFAIEAAAAELAGADWDGEEHRLSERRRTLTRPSLATVRRRLEDRGGHTLTKQGRLPVRMPCPYQAHLSPMPATKKPAPQARQYTNPA
jgi:hypothetical protein